MNYSYDLSGNVTGPTLSAPPQIAGQPLGHLASPGDVVTFSVVVSDERAVTLQWKFNGTDIAGATSDSLVLTNVSPFNEGLYSVVVTSSAGSVISAPAALMLDVDSDGLPDNWEKANLGSTSQGSASDPDGDGVSNLDEFLDGTDPNRNSSFRPRLKAYGSAGGSVTVTPMKLSYDLGDTVTLTASPFAPSVFAGWAGDLKGSSNPVMLTMNGHKTVRARFAVAAPLPPGLIALWRGETDASDLIGGHHGAFFAAAVVVGPSVTAAGKAGGAFSFDGTVHVRVPDSALLRPAQLTAEAWVFPTAARAGTIIARGSSTNDFDTWYLGLSNSRNPEFISHDNHTVIGLPIPLNEWTHLAITFDGVKCRLYVNGAQVAARDEVNPLVYDAAPVPLTIGSDWASNVSSARFTGRIDEIALYNRALSTNEILAIYNADFLGKDFSQPYFSGPDELPDGVLGAAYSQQVVAILGAGPLTFSLSTGVLPPGMTLSPTGVVSGVPGLPGVFVFTARATDAGGGVAGQRYVLEIFDTVKVPPGLVGWWRGESNSQDAAGSNHGVLHNGVGFVPGRVGQAFTLDGTDDYIEISDAPSLRPLSVTLEAWVAFVSVSGRQSVVAKLRATGPADSYALWLDGGTIQGAARDAPLTAPFAPLPGSWYHLAYTLDAGAKQQALYVDGVRVAVGPAGSPIAYDAQPLVLGRGQAGGGIPAFFFHGRIDEVSIYDRALSGAEIASIFNAGAAGKTL